jgi:hypothetical protein
LFRFQSFTGFAMLSDNKHSPIKTRNAAAGEALAPILTDQQCKGL